MNGLDEIQFIIYMTSLLSISLVLVLLLGANGWCKKHYFTVPANPNIMEISPDNSYMAITSTGSNKVYVYDLYNYNRLLEYTPSSGTVVTAKFSIDGNYLAIALNNRSIVFLSGGPTFNQTIKTTLTTTNLISDIDFSPNGNNKLLVCFTTNLFHIYSNYLNSTSNTVSFTSTASTQITKCKFSKNDSVVFIDNANTVKVIGSGNTMTTNCIATTHSILDVKLSTGAIKFIVGGANQNSFYGTDPTSTLTTSSYSPLATPGSGNAGVACYAGDGQFYTFANTGGDVYIFADNNSLYDVFGNVNANLLSCKYTHNGQYLYAGASMASSLASIFIYKKNCFQCPLGYYQSASTTCTLCNTLSTMKFCASCSNSTTCVNCYPGYYLNLTTRLCVKCNVALPGCQTCIDSGTCVECAADFFPNSSNVCQSCSSRMNGCLTCNTSSNCLVCMPEYYNQNGTCTLCNNSQIDCFRCYNQTYCLECKEGYFVNSTRGCTVCSSNCTSCDGSSFNCTTCVRGFYISSAACVPCKANCLECNNTNYCLDCKVGSYITPDGNCSLCSFPCNTCNSTNCLTCYVGAYLLNGNCVTCIGNCSTCVSATNCSSCSFGFYLRTSDSTCQSCSQLFGSCSSCNTTACFSCLSGYYLFSNNTCGVCSLQGCLICNSSSICQSCALGYYMTSINTCTTCNVYCDTCYNSASNCSSCIPGYYISGTSCVPCSNQCLTCNSTLCYSCSPGYYLSSGSCVHCRTLLYGCSDCYNSTYCNNCDVGKYLTASNVCLDCASNCTACNLTSCISCNVGYYLSSGSCLKCMDNCSECYSGSNCSSCTPGYYFDASLTVNQCRNCWVLSRGCLFCNQTSCFNCQIGYYLNSGDKLCYMCKDSITNCLQCIGNANCIACSQGFYLNTANSSCLACSLAATGCEICSNATLCTSCSVGYYLAGTTCTSCPSKCLICNSTSCLTCAFRFIMNASDCRNCDSLINHCQVCNSSTNCIQCYEGFYLSSGLCLSCQSQVDGCAFCNSSSICTVCLEGYFLSSGTCKICSVSEGCRLCTGLGTCSACYSGYTVSGSGCVLCSSLLSNCIFCSNSTVCLQCSGGYHLNNGVCVSCGTSINKCISCYNSTNCTQCEGGHYLNNSVCEPCTVSGCQFCNAITPGSCVNCYSGYYLSVGNCYQCNMTGCIDCNSSSVCISCDSGYYITSTGCQLCSSTMSGCSKCSSGTVCTSCSTLFYLSGNACLPCSKSLAGCAFCMNQTACLSCNSGYYLNATSLCSLCTTITGCILCRDISTCLYCASGYYLSAGSCLSCSSISNCSDCSNSSICTSCISGFALTGGSCVQAQTSGSASGPSASQTKKLKWKSYYVSDSELRHVLLSVDMAFQRPNIDLKVSSKISLKNKTTSIPLTINRFEWGRPNQIIFYTNNPLSIQKKTLPLIKRLLIGQSFNTNLDSSFEISQPILAQLLPNLLNDQEMILGYSLNDPQFYASLVFAVYNTYYYVFGLALSCILFMNYLLKALCTVPHSNDHGNIIGHLFALKVIAISIYPTFGEYINYCYGFMMADLPWLNEWFGYYLSDPSDITPLGYSIYYSNMSIFSMYLLPLIVFTILYSFVHFACGEKEQDKFKLEKTTSSQMLKKRKNRQKALKEFITNFFYFGLIFAGCASLQGSILNPRNIISLNGVGYIIGIVLYVIMISDSANQFYKHSNFQKIRLVIKASLLSLSHFNPIYIFAAAITIDICFIVLSMKLRYKYLVAPKTYLVVNILANFSLSAIFYFPDSFFSIYLSAGCIGLAVIGEFYTHYIEKNISLEVYPFHTEEIIAQFEKVNKGEETQWKINMEDYSLEKLNKDFQNFKDKEMILDEKISKENPIIFEQPNDMATTKFFQMRSTKQTIESNPRRQRRFREANKTKTTILSSSLSSLQI